MQPPEAAIRSFLVQLWTLIVAAQNELQEEAGRGGEGCSIVQMLLELGLPGCPPSQAIGKVQGVPDSVRGSGSVGARCGGGTATPPSYPDLGQ